MNPWKEGPPPEGVDAYWCAQLTDSWAILAPSDPRPEGERYKPAGMVWWRRVADVPGGDYAVRNFTSWHPHVELFAMGSTMGPTTILVGNKDEAS